MPRHSKPQIHRLREPLSWTLLRAQGWCARRHGLWRAAGAGAARAPAGAGPSPCSGAPGSRGLLSVKRGDVAPTSRPFVHPSPSAGPWTGPVPATAGASRPVPSTGFGSRGAQVGDGGEEGGQPGQGYPAGCCLMRAASLGHCSQVFSLHTLFPSSLRPWF